MAVISIPQTTEQRYQHAVRYYTQTGMVETLKRQWEFLKQPDQKGFFAGAVLLTVTTVGTCTLYGAKKGKELADIFFLAGKEKVIVIVAGGTAGFSVGVGLSIIGNALLIEHSDRMAKWKELNINNIVSNLMKEDFIHDPILRKFEDGIVFEPMFYPMRTPAGQVFDYNSLLKSADSYGVLKDIYNKQVLTPTARDPNRKTTISYSIQACVPDDEMNIVIMKRFRHLAFQKSQEPGLSEQTKKFFIDYRNALGEFVKPIYMKMEERIVKKKNDVLMKEGVTEEEAEIAETQCTQELGIFKALFGTSPFSNLDWNVDRDWFGILNRRWMKEHHS